MESTFKPYDGTDPYIFVSYSRKDAETVLPAVKALAGAGYRVWYDEGIPWTEAWPRQIAERMDGCAVCLAFHSAASAKSRHCIAELHRALSKERHILSVYLEEGVQLDPGLEMYLDLVQSVKLYEYADIDAFVERLTREKAFAPCKEPEWNKIGQIQWKLDAQGVLTIAKNEDRYGRYGSIPPYQWDPTHVRSTAPWMPYQEKIRSVVIQNDIRAIGDHAFNDCTSLTSVTIPDSVISIGDWAFADCKGLTSVTIPDSVTTIGYEAFAWCAYLTSVTIPDGVTTIGDRAFAGCEGLTSVTIGARVTTIGEGAFSGCTGLTAIHVDKANRSYRSLDGVLFNRKTTTLVQYPIRRAGKTYTVPECVTTINDMAFAGCEGLTSVTIPDSVTTIGKGAFAVCAGLTSVTIPDSVTVIDDMAFAGCGGLTSVTIPDSVTTIGDFAFRSCRGLTSVTIPNSVTTIGIGAFWNCKGLTKVEILADAELGRDVFPDHVQIIRRAPRGE